jgi:predicted AAA+ superfamily ATPase
MISRRPLQEQIKAALGRSPAVVLVGPRQAGKTTVARELLPLGTANYFDLDDPLGLARLAQPKMALQNLPGLIVIDEIQHELDLLPVLRGLIDRDRRPGLFLLLGSASPVLLRRTRDSLADRAEVIEVGGFDLEEVGAANQEKLWLRGGFPLAFTATSDKNALPQFAANVAPAAMLRFWTMLSHYHGEIWNAADPARSLGVSEPTVRRYLDWLTQGSMVRQLYPWQENLGKRQVKAPKVYFRDTGMLHALLGISDRDELLAHPKSGASWEGFALEQVVRIAQPDKFYFWATHTGAGLDLLMFKYGKRVGVEFKRVDEPSVTPSMRHAMEDLKLDALYVVYPGTRRFDLADGIQAVPLQQILPTA